MIYTLDNQNNINIYILIESILNVPDSLVDSIIYKIKTIYIYCIIYYNCVCKIIQIDIIFNNKLNNYKKC